MTPEDTTPKFATDKIGFACYLLLNGAELIDVKAQRKNRAFFWFRLSPQIGAAQEVTYITSDYSKFFETFKYLRSRALRGV
jgi:hypothetical protein